MLARFQLRPLPDRALEIEQVVEEHHPATADAEFTLAQEQAVAAGAYHVKRDENREIGLGPEHDWSSHAADAFGLMAIAYRDPRELTAFHTKILNYPRLGIA